MANCERAAPAKSLLEDDFAQFSARVRHVSKRAAMLTLSAAMVVMGLFTASVFVVLIMRYIVVPRGPASLAQDLVFDYTAQHPLATASFTPEKFANARATSIEDLNMRIVNPNQEFEVEIEFTVPESEYNADVGMFQVHTKMLTPNGKTLHESSRPGVLKYTSREVRWLKTIVWWPLYAFGFIEEQQNVHVMAVKKYREDRETPFTNIEVTMKPHAGSTKLPQIYEARVRINLSMGMLAKALYFYPIISFGVLVMMFWSSFTFIAFSFTVISLLVMGTKIDDSVEHVPSKYDAAIADAMDTDITSKKPSVTSVSTGSTGSILDNGIRRRNIADS